MNLKLKKLTQILHIPLIFASILGGLMGCVISSLF